MTATQDTARTAASGVTHHEDVVRSPLARHAMGALRLVLGFSFVWAFVDELFGFGYTTPAGQGWVDGGSPTTDLLTKDPAVTEGALGDLFAHLAGGAWDWLFMAALLGIGLAVLLGAGMKLAAWAGVVLLGLLYLAELPIGRPDAGFANPLVDSRWVEALALLVLAHTFSGDTLGIGRWWGRLVGDGILR